MIRLRKISRPPAYLPEDRRRRPRRCFPKSSARRGSSPDAAGAAVAVADAAAVVFADTAVSCSTAPGICTQS